MKYKMPLSAHNIGHGNRGMALLMQSVQKKLAQNSSGQFNLHLWFN